MELHSTILWHLKREVRARDRARARVRTPNRNPKRNPIPNPNPNSSPYPSPNPNAVPNQVPLCYLAKRAIDFDRASAYSCCVVGNCFSLQKVRARARVSVRLGLGQLLIAAEGGP